MGAPGPTDRAPLREGLIAGGFLLLCVIALFTVVLPELQDEPEDLTDTVAVKADAGLP